MKLTSFNWKYWASGRLEDISFDGFSLSLDAIADGTWCEPYMNGDNIWPGALIWNIELHAIDCSVQEHVVLMVWGGGVALLGQPIRSNCPTPYDKDTWSFELFLIPDAQSLTRQSKRSLSLIIFQTPLFCYMISLVRTLGDGIYAS